MKFSKKCQKQKNMPLKWYSSMKKKNWKDSDNFWHRKLTLKVRNRHFLITWFRMFVDLPKKWRWKSAINHSIKLLFDVELAEIPFNSVSNIRQLETKATRNLNVESRIKNLKKTGRHVNDSKLKSIQSHTQHKWFGIPINFNSSEQMY